MKTALRCVCASVLLCFFYSAAYAELPSNLSNESTSLLVRIDPQKRDPQRSDAAQFEASDGVASLDMVTKVENAVDYLLASTQRSATYYVVDLPSEFSFDSRLYLSNELSEENVQALVTSVWGSPVKPALEGAWHFLPLRTRYSKESWLVEEGNSSKDWSDAIAANTDAPILVAWRTPEYVVNVFGELNPPLPAILGGGEAGEFVNNLDWISWGIDPQRRISRIVVQARSEEGAKKLETRIRTTLETAIPLLASLNTDVQTLRELSSEIDIEVQGRQILIHSKDAEGSERFFQIAELGMEQLRTEAMKLETSNRLKKQILAIHDYYGRHGTLPTYTRMNETGSKSQLSWRVHILPELGYEALYNQFHLDEAWDSPHNIRLLDQMPNVYAAMMHRTKSQSVQPYHTTYLSPVGDGSVLGQSSPVGFSDIPSGMSNTIMLVDVRPEYAIPWTSPEEYPYNLDDPVKGLRDWNDMVLVSFMDGSVRTVRRDKSVEYWNAAFTYKGRVGVLDED